MKGLGTKLLLGLLSVSIFANGNLTVVSTSERKEDLDQSPYIHQESETSPRTSLYVKLTSRPIIVDVVAKEHAFTYAGKINVAKRSNPTQVKLFDNRN